MARDEEWDRSVLGQAPSLKHTWLEPRFPRRQERLVASFLLGKGMVARMCSPDVGCEPQAGTLSWSVWSVLRHLLPRPIARILLVSNRHRLDADAHNTFLLSSRCSHLSPSVCVPYGRDVVRAITRDSRGAVGESLQGAIAKSISAYQRSGLMMMNLKPMARAHANARIPVPCLLAALLLCGVVPAVGVGW